MKKKLHILTFLVLISQIVLADSSRHIVDGIAARVNNRVVTIGEALMVMKPMHDRLSARFSGEELKKMLSKAYSDSVELLVSKELILDAYEKQDAKLPDWVIENRINRIIREVFNDDRRELEKVLERDGMTIEEWRKEIKDQMIVTSMRSSMVDQYVTVSPRAVRKYYEKHRDEFRASGKAKLRMIMIKHETGKKVANDILTRLAAGQSFDELARGFSDGARADDGGDWGWIDPAILRRELAGVVKNVEVGAVSDIVETDDAYYIIKVEGRRAGDEPVFENVEPQIVETLRKNRTEELYKAWIERLKAEAEVQVFGVKIFE